MSTRLLSPEVAVQPATVRVLLNSDSEIAALARNSHHGWSFYELFAPTCTIGILLGAIIHPQTTTTNCPVQPVEFSKIGKRKIITELDGGRMSFNAGALALRESDSNALMLKSNWMLLRPSRPAGEKCELDSLDKCKER